MLLAGLVDELFEFFQDVLLDALGDDAGVVLRVEPIGRLFHERDRIDELIRDGAVFFEGAGELGVGGIGGLVLVAAVGLFVQSEQLVQARQGLIFGLGERGLAGQCQHHDEQGRGFQWSGPWGSDSCGLF